MVEERREVRDERRQPAPHEPLLEEPAPGRYRHFKGQDYVVLGIARHSETDEEFVVYRQDYGDRRMWVRPKAMFLQHVEHDGRTVERFRCVER